MFNNKVGSCVRYLFSRYKVGLTRFKLIKVHLMHEEVQHVLVLKKLKPNANIHDI